MAAARKQKSLQAIVAENVRALMVHHYGKRNLSRLGRALSPGASGSQATGNAQRIAGCANPDDDGEAANVRIDMIERAAAHFNLEPWQLLLPGLDPASPQQAVSAEELAKVAEFVRLAREIRAAPSVSAGKPAEPNHTRK